MLLMGLLPPLGGSVLASLPSGLWHALPGAVSEASSGAPTFSPLLPIQQRPAPHKKTALQRPARSL